MTYYWSSLREVWPNLCLLIAVKIATSSYLTTFRNFESIRNNHFQFIGLLTFYFWISFLLFDLMQILIQVRSASW